MTGRVCPKHEEWCPTGECRWCEPEPPQAATESTFARRTRERLDAAKALIASGMNPALAASCAFDHYASCPLRGPIGNPAQDLAAGCTCVPFP